MILNVIAGDTLQFLYKHSPSILRGTKSKTRESIMWFYRDSITSICFQLLISGNIKIKIYDVLSREVSTLLDEYREAGYYEVSWDASSQPSGVYFYKLQAGCFTSVKKMLLMK